MISRDTKSSKRLAIKKRVRAKIVGSTIKPRLSIFKSLNNIYAQLINDENGTTIVSASTLDKEINTKASNIEAAKEVGTLIAKRAIKLKIEEVVFDRNGYLYHGKVKALADSAREAGLKF